MRALIPPNDIFLYFSSGPVELNPDIFPKLCIAMIPGQPV